MDALEREIYYFLKARKPEAIPARELSRRVGGRRRFRADPDWVGPVLRRMVERGILVANEAGFYRLKPIPPAKTTGKLWASPEMTARLKGHAKSLDKLVPIEDEDDYYDKL
jgi:hypothetical protein